VLVSAGLVDTEYFTEEGRLRGQYVAQATAYADAGELDRDSVDPVLMPYLLAWSAFIADSGIEIKTIEQKLFNPIGYCGSSDRTGVMPYVGDVVIDTKLGGQYEWHAIQLAAYAACLGAQFRRVNVILKPDATYTIKVHETPQARDFDVFRAALCLHNWRNK